MLQLPLPPLLQVASDMQFARQRLAKLRDRFQQREELLGGCCKEPAASGLGLPVCTRLVLAVPTCLRPMLVLSLPATCAASINKEAEERAEQNARRTAAALGQDAAQQQQQAAGPG